MAPPPTPLPFAAIPTICLLGLLTAQFPTNESGSSIPPALNSQIYDALVELSLNCIYEEQRPASLRAWLTRITVLEPKAASKKEAGTVEETIGLLRRGGLDALHGWLTDIVKTQCPNPDDEENTLTTAPLHRISPCALYLRRSRMSFLKMSFAEAVAWWDEFEAWCDGRNVETVKGKKKKMADAYHKARARDDYQALKDSMSYYDIDDGTSHKQPQYALLNTAYLEYELGGLGAARDALTEAVQLARRAGDARCLVACSSLWKRLESCVNQPGEDAGSDGAVPSTSAMGSTVGEGRPSPSDILWDIKQALGHTHSTTALFVKLYASRALFHTPPIATSSKEKGRMSNWNDSSWGSLWHISASSLWADLGVTTLSELREEMAFERVESDSGNAWDARLTYLSRRAAKLSAAHKYSEALQILFRAVDTRIKRRAMGMSEFRAWERAVWSVVEAKAKDKGQEEILLHISGYVPPANAGWEITDFGEGAEMLRKGCQQMEASHYVAALSTLLKALHLTTVSAQHVLRLQSLFRIITCRLAISPTEGEADRSLLELESLWAEVIAVGRYDQLILAQAWEAKARARVLKTVAEDQTIEEAVDTVTEAYRQYTQLDPHDPGSLRTLALLVKLCDHASTSPLLPPLQKQEWTKLRDAHAATFVVSERAAREGRHASAEDWGLVKDVEKVVAGVRSAVIASVTRS